MSSEIAVQESGELDSLVSARAEELKVLGFENIDKLGELWWKGIGVLENKMGELGEESSFGEVKTYFESLNLHVRTGREILNLNKTARGEKTGGLLEELGFA